MRRVLWFLPNMVQLACIIVWTTSLVLIAMLIAVITRSADVPLWMARRIWAPGVLRILLVPLTVEFDVPLDFDRSWLFVSNHESALDTAVLFHALPVPLRFIAKKELFSTPVIGWYLRLTGMIPVDRANREHAFENLKRAREHIREGDSLLAFPEGTRNHGGAIRPFKRGPFVLAIQSRLPVVPVAIDGSGRVLHRSSMLAIPGPITIRFGSPISTESLEVADRASLTAQAEAAVRELRGRQPRR